ncbi:MAG: pilus assembly protein [Chloroflexi bacterium]|nr:pilus assembly protein [Chloroflexota bacterium]
MTLTVRKWRGRFSRRGQALVELALTAPILIVMLLGVCELGVAYNAHVALVGAAREGARLAARGGVYTDDSMREVVKLHAGSLDITDNGSIVVTKITVSGGAFTSYTTSNLLGSASSKFTSADLSAIQAAAAASDPTYLGNEKIVVVEVFYNYQTLTNLFGQTFPMYSYTIMPVSAPS